MAPSNLNVDQEFLISFHFAITDIFENKCRWELFEQRDCHKNFFPNLEHTNSRQKHYLGDEHVKVSPIILKIITFVLSLERVSDISLSTQ